MSIAWLDEIANLSNNLAIQANQCRWFLDRVNTLISSEVDDLSDELNKAAKWLFRIDPNSEDNILTEEFSVHLVSVNKTRGFLYSDHPTVLVELIQLANADSPSLLDVEGTKIDAHKICLNAADSCIDFVLSLSGQERALVESVETSFLDWLSPIKRLTTAIQCLENECKRAQKFYIENRQFLESYFLNVKEPEGLYSLIKRSSNEDYIVQAMVSLGCIDEASKQGQPAIVKAMDSDGDVNSFKKYFPKLQKKGVIKKGEDGYGFYVMPKFVAEVGAKKIDTSAPPTI